MKLGGLTLHFEGIDAKVFEVVTGYKAPLDINSLIASLSYSVVTAELGTPAAITAACTGWVYQDDDAHETCSLTACLNPLHPGPCKGWKGNLFEVAPNAFHALESARVEKANAARLKKIQTLKDAGKPIPKKLLQPIVAKPHPHAGKTANAATGEAHAAGQAVTDAAGVHVQTPGKVTLGQAVKQIKATDATPEKGPKGKKPTVASKGIAAVIAQEKVTPQYKLDKAAKITPEQWNALSDDERSIIRGELTHIQKEGFGPQQKKATELLDALPAKGLKGGGTDTVTTPKGQVIQKVTLKDLENPPTSHPSPVQAPKPESLNDKVAKVKEEMNKGSSLSDSIKKVTGKEPDSITAPSGKVYQKVSLKEAAEIPNTASPLGTQKLLKKVGALDVTFAKGTDYEKHFKDVGLTGDHQHLLVNEGAGNWYITDKDGKKLQFLSKSGSVHLSKPEGEKAAPEKIAHEAKVAEHEAKISAAEQKLADLKKKGVENAAALDALKKQTALVTPDGTPYTTKTPTNIVKDIKKNGYADLILGSKKIRVGFENSDHPGKLTMTNGTGIDSFYVVKEPDGTITKLSKGEHVKVATPAEPTPAKIENAAPAAPEKPAALPKHVQHAADLANHKAPGAGLSKNHLAAYEKLTPEEFKSLDGITQGKIIQELQKGKTKFLDPKKVTASQALINKLQADQGSAPAAPKAADVGFHTHMTDHAVTAAQAKKAAAGQPVAAHAAVAKELADLDLADQPDVMAHHNAAKQYGKDLVASYIKDQPPEALKDPAVQQEMQNVAAAAYALKQAQLIGVAKKNAFNKIDKLLKGDQGKLSPMQKASLAEYQKYLLAHPANTEPEQIVQLQHDVLNATSALNAKLKAAKAPKAADMTPMQLNAKVAELLGPEAALPNVNLTMAELKESNETGKHMSELGIEKYSKSTLENPEVAAKQKQVALVAGQLAATAENKKKLQEHLKKYHFKALNEHQVGGGSLSDADAKVIEAHAAKIKNDHAYLDTVYDQQQEKLIEARKAFDKAADEVENAPHEPVTLSDYDVATISEAYGNNWGKQASKAVVYGLKTYSQKVDMKAHPEYSTFTQDLGNLQQAVKNLALAHAHEHTAGLNVPTDPNTGAKLAGPEKQAWLSAAKNRMQAESDYQKLYKAAQTRLDKIRTDMGLKKRALPKIDSPAVKAAAAESAYYKTGGYSGPNYGKQAAAKSYTLAKVGPKLGIKHQSAAEKKAEKAAAEQEKLKAAHPDFYAKKEADKAANAAKATVSTTDAGKTPNQAAAEQFGWNYTASTAPALGQWGYSAKGAYFANDEHLKAAQDILTGPDIQHGLAAQKQFKWSINNMQGKGATASQRNALYSYTGSGYESVNSKLNSLPPGVEKTGSTTITNIDSGMAASPPLDSDVVLYRGFKSPKSVFSSGKWNDTNVAGMEWSQRSYSSTSGTLSTAEGFAGHGGVVMRVIIPKGMKVHGINAKGGMHASENEIILQRGLRYRVVADYGKHGSDGKRYIDVMVVPSPYAKAE